ncbi:MAG TPA: thiamine pyrophosphate-dependent enzyme [Candidatus Limnocylindrales bacterium]|nr:thiamine pyrophosphate-dependent enzyme [Candidatus Limnocylindrales bacterium]
MAAQVNDRRSAQSGGQAVAAALAAGGVRFAFTVPGESFLPLLEGLADGPIRTVATRHEGGAAFMAEAVGQLTGRPAACLATRAVGAANLAIGLHTAYADSTPMIALVGQVPRAMRGREAFQEVDQVATFGGLCKAATELDDPADLSVTTSRLLRLACSGRPGPVLLALPEDVLGAEVEAVAGGTEAAPAGPHPDVAAIEPAPDQVEPILARLAVAHRPIIVAGAGVLRAAAVPLLAELVEAIEVPVIASWRRPDVLPNDHRLYLGMSGLGAPASVRRRLLEADLILALGCRLNAITTFDDAVPAPGSEVIHVDLEPGWPGRPLPQRSVRADARAFLEVALRLVAGGRGRPADAAARRAADRRDRAAYEADTTLPVPGREGPVAHSGIAYPTVVSALQAALPPAAVVTTDAGNFAAWYARYLHVGAGQRLLGPTSGAMGYGLPAAIGAAVAEPGRPVVALAGDGGMAMLLAELETAVREGARLAVVVHDNQRYGTIRMHQERAFPGRPTATELGPIDFAAVARACGARGLTVERDGEVAPALAQALEADGVTLVHLRMDPQALSVETRLP